MQRYYKENVTIIFDEYDTPMQEAWFSGYWDKAVGVFSNFFNATFKTNLYLERGVITGIIRIAKESTFTRMNNFDVITTTPNKYATAFGFTEKEVFDALDDMELGNLQSMVYLITFYSLLWENLLERMVKQVLKKANYVIWLYYNQI